MVLIKKVVLALKVYKAVGIVKPASRGRKMCLWACCYCCSHFLVVIRLIAKEVGLYGIESKAYLLVLREDGVLGYRCDNSTLICQTQI